MLKYNNELLKQQHARLKRGPCFKSMAVTYKHTDGFQYYNDGVTSTHGHRKRERCHAS